MRNENQPGLEYDNSNVPGLEVYEQIPSSQHSRKYNESTSPQPRRDTSILLPTNETLARRILGLTVPIFWGITIFCAVMIAAGLGAGVGLGLASKNTCPVTPSTLTSVSSASISFSSTSTETSSSLSPDTASSQSTIISSSPSATITTTTATTTSSSSGGQSPVPSSQCDNTHANANGSNATAIGPSGNAVTINSHEQVFQIQCNTNYPSGQVYGNPGTRDIMSMYSTSLDNCLAACAEYNVGYNEFGSAASGGQCISVALIKGPGGACYLKNGTGLNDTAAAAGFPVDSAVLWT